MCVSLYLNCILDQHIIDVKTTRYHSINKSDGRHEMTAHQLSNVFRVDVVKDCG